MNFRCGSWKQISNTANQQKMLALSANSNKPLEVAMASRAPLPWVLTWDENGELEIHDQMDLLLSEPVLEKACDVPINHLSLSPWAKSENVGWLPICSFPELDSKLPHLEAVESNSGR
ncbi:MAG TPA: hypothetical protein DEB19_02750 [Synechococcales bacterium UBA8138]|uniref:hypothetical protein n=1 Tax=Synechococcus lacustris TaxID=2116544 RepID=UPI000E82E942|nr:hypothetical protein [Synechococcus lacustris]MCP9925649.1 hypothetical protein [Synechococcus lacustris C3-12m-Tous]HBU26253.1 hypothetical protein [Synechococcales bacterium UBA8138]